MIEIPVGISVRYLLENVHTVTGRRTPLSGWSPNIMLEVATAMNIMADRSDWTNFVQVGTSSVAPNPAQSTLVAWVAGTNNALASPILNAQSDPPYYGSNQVTMRFLPGDIPTNDPLNEVAMGYGDGSGGASDIVSRARIVDTNGDFTSPTPDPTEFLDVTREVRYVPPTVPVVSTIMIDSVNYDYTLMAANVTDTEAWASRIGIAIGQVSVTQSDWRAFAGPIGTIDSEPSGLSAPCSNADQFNYGYVNLSRTIGMGCSCDPGSGIGNSWNLTGGIRSLRIRTTAGDYQIQLGEGANATGNKVPKSDAFSMFTKYFLTWANGPVV
jgi:hypothetical protein